MNKVTLSLVALAAVGGTAQVQAADMTQEQKDAAIAAKKAAIDEIRLTLNAVSNQINAECPDVKANALLQLSVITQELNDLYDDDNKFEVPDVNKYGERIRGIKDVAVNAQKPYNTKASLVAKYNTMKAEYDKALTNASDKVKYPNVSADKVLTLKNLNVEAILADINAYNLAEQIIVNEAGVMENRINKASETIKQVNESIDQDEKNSRSNEDANKAVIAAYNKAKANYDAQLDEAIKKLPSDNYKDWQEEVVEKLNEQYRIIVAAKKSNDTLYKEGKAAEGYATRQEDINNANAVITSVVADYVGKMDSQEKALKNANDEVANLNKGLVTVKTALDGRGLTECNADIAAIKKSISDLNATIAAQYKAHTISSWSAGAAYTNILKAINEIDDNNGHSAQALCDNYDANKSMEVSVADVQKKLNAAETTAKTASEDKAYNAADHYTATLTAVQKNIGALSKAVNAAYVGKTAVKYKNETLQGKLDAITKGTNDYASNTVTALAAYNTAAKTIVDQNKLLDALKKEATDLNVTVDGKVGSASYAATIANVEKEIKAIQDKIDAANKLADAAHLGSMQAAAGMKVAEDLAQLIKDYKANKTAFDLASAQNSAQSYLAQAQTIIDEQNASLVKISADRDFGNKQADVDKKKAELEKKVGEVQKAQTKAQTDYDTVNNDATKTAEEKMNAAATAIAELSKISENLEALKKDVAALTTLADNAEANKKAYDRTIAQANSTSSARKTLNGINDYIVGFNDDATPYYQGEITKLKAQLTNTETAITTAYGKQESVAKEAGFGETIKAIVANAETLKAAVQPNVNQYKAQAQAANDLQKTWQTTYDAISVNDLSDAAAGYLKDLAPLREQVTALQDKVLADFKVGKSVAQKDVNAATNKDLSAKILAIGAQSKDNYDANVAATNENKHVGFVSNYDAAYKAFADAVDVLNKFTKIQDASVKKFVNEDEDLIKTHDAIYAFADKLRNLKTNESNDYATFVNQTNKDYGKYDMYDPAEWVKIANQYQTEINAALVSYQNTVNQKAYDVYNTKVTAAESDLTTYKSKIAAFVYDGKAKAFKDVEDVVNEAKLAGTLVDGAIQDKLYAVNVDKWNLTLDNVASLLSADLAKACNDEKDKLVADASALYEKEKTAIASFKEINNADYLKQLAELKANTIDKATEKYQATPTFVDNTVRVKCGAYANGLEHSAVYTTAYNLSVANVKNVDAYNRMIAKLNTASTSLDAAIEDLGTLMATHSAVLNSQIKGLSADLATKVADTESAKEIGACVGLEATVNSFVDTELKTRLATLQNSAIDNEITVLGTEIDKVKEEYNQVAKTDLDKVKDYDAKIKNDLYKVLLINSEAGSNVETSIQWKWMNGKLSYDVARAALVAHEAKIATIKTELNGLYTNTKTDEAIASLDKQVSSIEVSIAQASTWAAYNTATKKYEAAVQTAQDQLAKAKENYAAKKSSVLLYQDVLAFDFAEIASATVLTDGKLQAEYNKQKTNDDVFNALNEKIAAAKASLETAYNNVKDMKYAGLDAIKAWNANVTHTIDILSIDRINVMHNQVQLTTVSEFDEAFEVIANETKMGEIQAKYNQANGLIYALSKKLGNIRANYEDGNYSDSRKNALRDEGIRINNSLWYAYNYNNDVKNDGLVSWDIDGNDVRVEIDGLMYGVAEDYLEVTWKKLDTRLNELQTATDQLEKDAKNFAYVVGDADGNGKVNVNDYNEVRSLVLASAEFAEVEEAKAYAADVDKDKEFTVADMTKISNLVFHGNSEGATDGVVRARMMTRGAEGDAIAINKQSEETTVFGKTVKVAVNVSGAQEFTAGQFDIQLPAGMKLAGQELTDRANGHELFSNDLGNGLYRFVAATIENTAFSGNNGALVVLDVEVSGDYAGGEIEVINGIFSDAQGNAYGLVSRSIGGGNGTTGIDSITAPTTKERIYSIGGMVKKTIQKGINIIKREDGTTRKVIKK